jgi:hypothetical protein
MPVAVAQPNMPQQEDPLDKLAKIVGIAKAGFGIAADMGAIHEARARKKDEDKLRGLQTQKLEGELAQSKNDDNPNSPLMGTIRTVMERKGIKLPEGTTPRQARTMFDAYMKPAPERAPKDPVAQELALGRLDEQKRKKEEEEQALMTNFGKARTKDDAKQLKEASELKEKLDREISELIQIRKDYGGEALNREVVGRAKQLSKSLLLTKKNLEKLGVLSQSDEAIVNEIIPADPTQFHMPLAGDPTLVKLEKFKTDTQSDFDARIANRIRPGGGQVAGGNAGSAKGMGLGAGSGALPKPKTVIQNGHTYTLQPDGSYK